MHKFLILLAFIPAIAASGTLAEAGDTRIGVLSDTPTLVSKTDTDPMDPSGTASITAGPSWISGEGSGTATIDEGAVSAATLTAGVAIRAGARSTLESPGMSAGSSDSRLDGPEASIAFAHQGGPVSACSAGGGPTSRPGTGDGLLGLLSADPTPISAAMGAIAFGSLAAAWGWKHRQLLASRSS